MIYEQDGSWIAFCIFLTLTAKCALYGEYAVLNNATLVKAWNQIFYALSFKDSWTSQKGLFRLQELFKLMASCASHRTSSNFQGAHWTFILFMAIFHISYIKPSSSKAVSWIEKKDFLKRARELFQDFLDSMSVFSAKLGFENLLSKLHDSCQIYIRTCQT